MLKCPCFGDFSAEDALRTLREWSDMVRRYCYESLMADQKGRTLIKELIRCL